MDREVIRTYKAVQHDLDVLGALYDRGALDWGQYLSRKRALEAELDQIDARA